MNEEGHTGMSQIDELQGRIAAAMERVTAGVGTLAERLTSQDELAAKIAELEAAGEPAGDGDSDAGDLRAALEEEKLANAQLEERVKLLKTKHAEEIATLRQQAEESAPDAADTGALDEEITALKSALEAKTDAAETAEAELRAELDARAATIDGLEADLKAAQDAAAQGDVGGDDLHSELETKTKALEDLDTELQRLRKANDELREANAALRDANAKGVGDAHLINKSMMAEVEGARAAQAADRAEVSAVLNMLEPLLSAATNLPEGEEE